MIKLSSIENLIIETLIADGYSIDYSNTDSIQLIKNECRVFFFKKSPFEKYDKQNCTILADSCFNKISQCFINANQPYNEEQINQLLVHIKLMESVEYHELSNDFEYMVITFYPDKFEIFNSWKK